MRVPKTRALADELIRVRKAAGITPILSGPDALIQIRQAMKGGALVGMLVDQYHPNGIEVTFFGRRCTMNPVFVRLARSFDAQIYGARIVRLPDRRFRYDIVGPLAPVARRRRGRSRSPAPCRRSHPSSRPGSASIPNNGCGCTACGARACATAFELACRRCRA